VLIFFLLAIIHFVKSTRKISNFEITSRPGSGTRSIGILGSNIDQPINNFVKDFNKYLKSYNNSSTWHNRRSAMGYIEPLPIVWTGNTLL